MIDITKHLALVPYTVNKMQDKIEFFRRNYEKEDLYSVGYIGLVKASKKFDESKNIKFSTFACKCITNEILKLSEREKYFNVRYTVDHGMNSLFSLDSIVSEDNSLEYKEVIPDDFALDEHCINNALLKHCIDILNEKERKIVILHYFYGLTQKDIGRMFNFSQSNARRIISIALNKMRKEAI